MMENMPIGKGTEHKHRLLVFTPTTGLVRMEWVMARYGQLVPTNWSMVDIKQFISPYVPIDYQLADAQNMLAKRIVEDDYQWVLFIEHDNIIPQDFFWKINAYMRDRIAPMVSGLYFTKSYPPEPILYRGRGNSFYGDWKLGDKVWVDGMPFGAVLVDAELIKVAWKESPEYQIPGTNETVRKVFDSPNISYSDPEKGLISKGGTTDLAWCTRIMEDGLLKKAGWPKHAKKKYPFLVDTNMLVMHIDQQGRQFPLSLPKEFMDGKITFDQIGQVAMMEEAPSLNLQSTEILNNG